MPRHIRSNKPTLFGTLGFPGSGKTHFARRFAKEFNVFHLNSDRVRLEIFPEAKHTREENRVIFRVMDFIAEELLRRGMSVIYDANSTKRIYKSRLRKIAAMTGSKYVLLWFQTPIAVALKRIEKRSNFRSERMKKYHIPADASVLHKIRREEEEPSRTESHIPIDGLTAYKDQVGKILKHLSG